MPFISKAVIAEVDRPFLSSEWPERGEVVVFDLEYTAWEGSLAGAWSRDWEYQEIVQIGAVRLDSGAGLREIGAFERFTLPVFNPTLSDYFTDLTGIDDEIVAREGAPFGEVYGGFLDFLSGASLVLANGMDAALLRQNVIWRSCDWPFGDNLFRNLRRFLASAMNIAESEATSSELPRILGLEIDFDPHTGLGDARAIAAALREIQRDGKL